jgi:hypothetical protein
LIQNNVLSLLVTNLSILILLTGIVLLHAGAFLIRIGHWPRRAGTDPFCRRCDYLLLGIESDRCPECGQFLSPRTIIRGHRRRRTPLTLLGVLLLFLGILTTIYSQSGQIRRLN